MTQGVTEDKAGTMSSKEGQAKVTPTEKGKAPGTVKVSPEDTPTITQKALDEAVRHATQSESGRITKQLEARELAVKDAESKETERQKVRDAKELEDAGDDKEQLTIVQQRHKLRDQEAVLKNKQDELEASRVTHQAEIDETRATKLETDIFTIATKHNVDPVWLKSLTQEPHNISSLKTLEEFAKGASIKKPFEPDSGKTAGGGETTEQARLDRLYPTMAKK